MPQRTSASDIALAHNIPFRKISTFEDLSLGINWAISLSGPILLHLSTNSIKDSLLRKSIINDLKKYIN